MVKILQKQVAKTVSKYQRIIIFEVFYPCIIAMIDQQNVSVQQKSCLKSLTKLVDVRIEANEV